MEEKCGDAKDGDSEFKKVQCPVCDESCGLEIAVYSRIKHLRREAKYYGRKSCAMDVIHQYHKITMQKHVNREEHARSVSSFVQQVYKDICQRRSDQK